MSPADHLSAGKGWCDCTALLALRIAPDVIEMEASPEILQLLAVAIHHVNRRSQENARVAIDIPGIDLSRPGFDRIGSRVNLFGNLELLSCLAEDRRVAGAMRSGKILTDGIRDLALEPGPGRLLVRSQTGSKSTRAGLARARRRIESRGGTWVEREHRGAGLPANGRHLPFLQVGDRKLSFIPRELPFTGRVEVSTYGFGDGSAQAGLPTGGWD